ncbi:MAG: oligoendopeptidase F [Spirochaetaceae bacterium]|nr:oligoendopeptidase F [Spirochaetaceae bacterium]
MSENTIPLRNQIPQEDKWDLTTLYKSDAEWEIALAKIQPLAEEIATFKGKLADSPETLLAAIKKLEQLEKLSELVGSYAFLLTAGDASDSSFQEKQGRYIMIATAAETCFDFLIPEIQSIDESILSKWIEKSDYDDYRVWLKKLLRLKPYILSEKEERLLTLQSEASRTAKKTFSMLTNVDMEFGSVETQQGEIPLSQSTYSILLENPDRKVRCTAYTQFYNVFEKHKNTIASLYEGSVNQDIFEARSRGYTSARSMALFPDKVPESVYDNLIAQVHEQLPVLHRYYSLRKKALKLNELRHYDVYVPLTNEVKTYYTYADAVEILRQALNPLGTEYTDILCKGLLGGWVDRYENKGKRSGAFSSGAYTGYPYILLNYKPEVLRDVFTMAHEGGHSMHSFYSAKSNPFMQYNYTIFEAEVASTFNEQLLFDYLLKNTSDSAMRAYLLSNRASDILATLHRQTMFAEFEMQTHQMVESGIPLSVDSLRKTYRKLLETYFGPEMIFEPESDLEGLRIPHFYNAFYVYKYATGISAALALAEKVTKGGKEERGDYFKFLKSGGSRYPIESLRIAGVDMESPEPVKAALDKFKDLVEELEKNIT